MLTNAALGQLCCEATFSEQDLLVDMPTAVQMANGSQCVVYHQHSRISPGLVYASDIPCCVDGIPVARQPAYTGSSVF